MYRSLYSFQTAEKGALSFKEGDEFTVMDTADHHWWLVQNGTGVLGFVPGNYLYKVSDVAHTEVIQSIDRAIGIVQQQIKEVGIKASSEQKTNLQKLQNHRRKILEEHKLDKEGGHVKRAAPAPPTHHTTSPAAQLQHTVSPAAQSHHTASPATQSHHTASPAAQSHHTASPAAQSHHTASPAAQSHHTASPAAQSHHTASPAAQSHHTVSPAVKSHHKVSPADQSHHTASPADQSHHTASPAAQSHHTASPESPDRAHHNHHSPHTKIDRKTSKRNAPPPPSGPANDALPHQVTSTNGSVAAVMRDKTPHGTKESSPLPEPTTSPPRMSAYDDPPPRIANSEGDQPCKINVPSGIGSELLQLVRRNTSLSYVSSEVAVNTICSHLKDKIPALAEVMEDIMQELHESKTKMANAEDKYDHQDDAVRLEAIFTELAACKDDSQQRSWFLHEDEHIISDHLEELIQILASADPDLCRHIITKDKYDAVHNLVLYYQMETRVSIRLLLLQAFGSLCGISKLVISELLTSVLPLELVTDVQSDSDVKKLSYSLLVLSMIFSMGESVPYQHYESMNQDFLLFLLTKIEDPPQGDDSISDLCFKVILSFNLHFELPEENLIMKTLAEKATAKTFTEKLLLLVNREDDPVRIFDHEPRPPNSLLKFLSDLYSTPSTASLLYTNDAMVLLDIVVRQLSDLSAGDPMRTEYLSLLHLIVQNARYEEHGHRQSELDSLLNAIANEDAQESHMDQFIVQRIFNDFPQIFSQNSDFVIM